MTAVQGIPAIVLSRLVAAGATAGVIALPSAQTEASNETVLYYNGFWLGLPNDTDENAPQPAGPPQHIDPD